MDKEEERSRKSSALLGYEFIFGKNLSPFSGHLIIKNFEFLRTMVDGNIWHPSGIFEDREINFNPNIKGMKSQK